MQKDDHIRLRHMLDAAREAELFIQSKTRDSMETDRKTANTLAQYHWHEKSSHSRVF